MVLISNCNHLDLQQVGWNAVCRQEATYPKWGHMLPFYSGKPLGEGNPCLLKSGKEQAGPGRRWALLGLLVLARRYADAHCYGLPHKRTVLWVRYFAITWNTFQDHLENVLSQPTRLSNWAILWTYKERTPWAVKKKNTLCTFTAYIWNPREKPNKLS